MELYFTSVNRFLQAHWMAVELPIFQTYGKPGFGAH
jgi:hypothetical protein